MDILEYINENLPKCVAYTPDSDGCSTGTHILFIRDYWYAEI